MLASLVIKLIHLYRWALSPLMAPRCRFVPTCSRYAIHAIELHGLIKGGAMSLRRLFRCHPFKKDAEAWEYDPVSEKPKVSQQSPKFQ